MKSKLFRKLEVLSRAEMVAQLSSKTKPPNVTHRPPQTTSRTQAIAYDNFNLC
ncbi:MAG: hypothetical protein ICV63_03735 [Coleofasciculus sp. Co-bin14]|nr:hypothetical protein [Coleofasciculus sp. Co-bin14]